MASQRTCTSLFVHGSSFHRSGVDGPDAGRGVCLRNPFGAADLSRGIEARHERRERDQGREGEKRRKEGGEERQNTDAVRASGHVHQRSRRDVRPREPAVGAVPGRVPPEQQVLGSPGRLPVAAREPARTSIAGVQRSCDHRRRPGRRLWRGRAGRLEIQQCRPRAGIRHRDRDQYRGHPRPAGVHRRRRGGKALLYEPRRKRHLPDALRL